MIALLVMAQIPGPRDNDLEDVSAALEVAQNQWGRGDHTEALRWLRKAAESAFEGGDDRRGIELSKVIADASGEVRAAKAKGRASMPSVPSAPPARETVATKAAVPKAIPVAAKPEAPVRLPTPSAFPGSFGPPRPATFPPPPLRSPAAETPRVVEAPEDLPKKPLTLPVRKAQAAKAIEAKATGLRTSSADGSSKKGATQPVVPAAAARKPQAPVRPSATATAVKQPDTTRKPSKFEPKIRQFAEDDDESTQQWTLNSPSNKPSRPGEAAVNLTIAADDWTTVDEPIDLNTGELLIISRLDPKITAKAEPKSTPKPDAKENTKVDAKENTKVDAKENTKVDAKENTKVDGKENTGVKRRLREAVSTDPLVSRPFTQAVRVAVSRNASGVIVARLLDLAGQLRDGEVEAMLVGMRSGELEDLFR